MGNVDDVIQQLEVEKASLEEKMVELNSRLRDLKRQLSLLKTQNKDWARLSVRCLYLHDEFLTTNEILNSLATIDELSNPIKRRDYVMKLSLNLNRLATSGHIVKMSNVGLKGNMYGLNEWLEGNELKAKYDHRLKVKLISLKKEPIRNYDFTIKLWNND